MTIETQLINYFKDTLDADVAAGTPLIEQGIIDSMGVMELITFIQQTFDVEFDVDDMTVEKLGTVTAISRLITSKRGEA
ncbi:acyl carrier protein [Geobacter grbiciae]|uniref:acyl carrier protein n=1 Tax=Geobacter grbiciae TaxID=155042 RepID=UPI001C009EC9|nr:acyl carrier protein [Geobacter grbiciae]MBT1074669.1 acyl carrier protein [Geobacter grbiciae]